MLTRPYKEIGFKQGINDAINDNGKKTGTFIYEIENIFLKSQIKQKIQNPILFIPLIRSTEGVLHREYTDFQR